ncbi:MarR family transcriptional regulator [Ruegeria sp. SCPT10]|uniref:MarR family winged helix-turn-helix transcriptional regulator n=1 Tax=Ruegeria sp. SCP10 TaxID=3141377 RepID=UPI003336C717
MNPQPQPDQEPLSKERLRLWLRILKLSSSVQAELRRRLRDNHDTTLPRFDVMAALSRYPDGLKMSELSDYLKVSNGNITGIIDRLAEEGLALRVAVPGDRRAMIARLTPKGTKAFADLAQHHEEWIDDRLGNLTREDAKTLTRLLNKALDDRNT